MIYVAYISLSDKWKFFFELSVLPIVILFVLHILFTNVVFLSLQEEQVAAVKLVALHIEPASQSSLIDEATHG